MINDCLGDDCVTISLSKVRIMAGAVRMGERVGYLMLRGWFKLLFEVDFSTPSCWFLFAGIQFGDSHQTRCVQWNPWEFSRIQDFNDLRGCVSAGE